MFTLFLTLLQVLFIGLKLTSVIAWGWLIVLLPIWIWILALVVSVVGYFIIMGAIKKEFPIG